MTSSTSSDLPSWNSTPLRILNLQPVASFVVDSHSSQSSGTRFPPASTSMRPLRHCPIAITAAIALKGNAGSSESLVELPEIPMRSRPPRLGAAARSVRGTARPPNAAAAPSAAPCARKARRVVAPIPEVAGSATRSRDIDPELEASFFVFIALSPLGARGPRTPDYTAPQWPARALIRRDATCRRHRGASVTETWNNRHPLRDDLT